MNAKDRTPQETLLRVFYFDVRKRYQILDEECQHLLQSTNFRDSAVAGRFPDSQQAFCKRLASAAQLLFDECQADWREIRAYKEQTENRWKSQQSNEEKQRQIQNATAAYSRNGIAFISPKFRLHHFDLIWHAKMMFKASLIAERIGDLHDRLAQLLQRTNPDHPDPTVRRRAEQGSIDKYLTEQTRWVHRDIARFAISVGTKYPYNEVPATFQSWEYDYTSRHHSFMPSASYACWTEWHCGDQSKRITPKKFASLRLSYWMTERMPLHPIIGHEIAHQVLRDSFGHILSHSRLENEEGQIARLFRRLVRCNEDWLARRPGVNAAAEAENISVEIVCDLLAAVRYGYAYAFAWILEIVGDENLAHLFDDETSMLQRFWTDEVRISTTNNSGDPAIQPAPPTVNLEDLRNNFLWGTQRLEQGLPKAYYRGYVLMHFLRELSRENADSIAEELSDALSFFLGALLDLYAGPDDNRRKFEVAFAEELKNTVCTEATSFPWRRSKFVRMANKFWEQQPLNSMALSNAPLQHQLLTNSYRNLLQSLAKAEKWPSKTFDWPNVRVMSDVAWRIEWLMEKHADEEPCNQTRINRVRAMLFLGADDYIYRTTNPSRFFEALSEKPFESPRDGNTVDPCRFKKIFDLSAVETIDTALRQENFIGAAGLKYNDKLISISERTFGYIDKILVRDDDLRNWLIGDGAELPEQYRIELIRARNYLLEDVTRASNTKFEPIMIANLLGRYDQVVIAKQAAAEGDQYWWAPGEQKKHEYVSRVKKLVRFGDGTRNPHYANPALTDLTTNHRVIAIVLVSLHWESFRSIVGRWLVKRFANRETDVQAPGIKSCLRFDMFLSDGWEDFVLLAYHDELEQECVHDLKYNQAVDEFLDVVTELNNHPLVKATESMFTSEILGRYSGARMRFRFVCRFGEDKTTRDRFRTIVSEAKASQIVLEERNLAGNKDTELIISHPIAKGQLKQFHQKLHDDELRDWRVETRVSWCS